jgi:hypothetical protein
MLIMNDTLFRLVVASYRNARQYHPEMRDEELVTSFLKRLAGTIEANLTNDVCHAIIEQKRVDMEQNHSIQSELEQRERVIRKMKNHIKYLQRMLKEKPA